VNYLRIGLGVYHPISDAAWVSIDATFASSSIFSIVTIDSTLVSNIDQCRL